MLASLFHCLMSPMEPTSHGQYSAYSNRHKNRRRLHSSKERQLGPFLQTKASRHGSRLAELSRSPLKRPIPAQEKLRFACGLLRQVQMLISSLASLQARMEFFGLARRVSNTSRSQQVIWRKVSNGKRASQLR